jgi:hypothetical protein
MTIRCKFQCCAVEKCKEYNSDRFLYTARFQAVTSGSEENKKFFAYTPGGQVTLPSYREDSFEPGKEYYFDITLAD